MTHGFLVGRVRVSAEQWPVRRQPGAGGAVPDQQRWQVAGLRQAQGPGRGVVDRADRRGHHVDKVECRRVQPGQHLGRAGSGDRQTAQAVAQGHHAGHGADAVPRDVADREQDGLVRQQGGVIPVPADQMVVTGGLVSRGYIDARGL